MLQRFLLALTSAAAFAGTEPNMEGWAEAPVKFRVQSPYNLPQSDRYSVSNGVYHLRVLNHDAAFASGNTTKPRTEQRFDPDYTSRQIQYDADLYMKDGVYTQTGASPEMQVYIKNIKFWTHP